MSVMGRIAGGGDAQAVVPGPSVNLDPWVEAFRSQATAAGRTVTVPGALGVAAVWAAVRVLSDTVGTLPIVTYRRQGESRTRASDLRVYKLLHDEPNPEMSAATFKRLLMVHLNTWGNAYVGKTFQNGNVTELWPIHPERVKPRRAGGQKVYVVDEGLPGERTFGRREIIHIFGLSLDGLMGVSPVGYARESIGSALAMDEYSNAFFRSGALPRMLLKSKGPLGVDGKKKLREQWEKTYRGSRNANRIAVLEEGMEAQLLSLPQRDLEFVEQRKHSVQEVARWFRVPASLIEGDKGGSLTYSTTEMDGLHLVTHSIRPWATVIEEELNRDLDLFPTNRIFCEFLMDELMRGTTLDRYTAHAIALDPVKGWMKPSEVRGIENLPEDPEFKGRAKPAAAPAVPAGPAVPGRR